jgi:Tfp pilus assembly protein PilV
MMFHFYHKKFTKKPGTAPRNTSRGFTLIETFIAVTILMVAVVGPITIAQRSLSSAKFSRDRVIAYYLAQDAIEYVRSVRDDAYRQGQPWSTGFLTRLTNCYAANTTSPATKWCTFDSQYAYDFPSNVLTCASEATCPTMNLSSSGVYNYQALSGTNVTTPFRRSINIRQASSNNGVKELIVEVRVHWESGLLGTGGGSFNVSENLMEWQL